MCQNPSQHWYTEQWEHFMFVFNNKCGTEINAVESIQCLST